jgi:hypothetical protein
VSAKIGETGRIQTVKIKITCNQNVKRKNSVQNVKTGRCENTPKTFLTL